MTNNQLIVHPPEIVNRRIVKCTFTVSKRMRPFFRDRCFWVKYGRKMDRVPPSLLIVPLLTNLLPIAWAANADVYCDEADQTFIESAERIRRTFRQFYPGLAFNGRLIAERIVRNSGYTLHKSATLFSGGVDSTATFLRHRSEKPALVTLWGSDIPLRNKTDWHRLTEYVRRIGAQQEVEPFFVKSNFRQFLDYSRLAADFRKFVPDWWGYIQHGWALAGFAAPLSYREGWSTFYIPSSYSVHDPGFPWGSHPSIDNHIRWGDTQVVHDAFELTRQQKLRMVAKHISRGDTSIQLRVCLRSNRHYSCGSCRKCLITILGLILEGVDPNRHGFRFDASLYETTRYRLLNGELRPGKIGECRHWEQLQSAIPRQAGRLTPEGRDFFRWLRTVNFREMMNKH